MDKTYKLIVEPQIKQALLEDWGHRDWTTDLCVPAKVQAEASIYCKEDVIMAGMDIAAYTFQIVDSDLQVTTKAENGAHCPKGTTLLTVAGNARSILKAERVALNYLARMCGIATLTRQYKNALEGMSTQLLDTRKSTPGLRFIEKLATSAGGARNHRVGLSDGVMVKENHIIAAGGITHALERLKESLPPTIKIEVETTNLDEVKEALAAGADIIMLDNMPIPMMEKAVAIINGQAQVEASGNINLETIRSVAETGVDFISTGALTHSSRWSDLSLLFNQK